MNTSSAFLTANRFVPCFVRVMLGFAVIAFLLCDNASEMRAQSGGAAWRQILPDSLPMQILRISANDSAVFVLGRLAVYRVENNRLVPFTLPNQQYPTLYATRSFHFAIVDSMLWRSRNGREWLQVSTLPSSISFLNIVASENERFHYATTRNGIYRSGDSGRTWQSAWLQGVQTWDMGIIADTIYAGGGCGSMQRSIDGGKTWSVEQFPPLGSEIYCSRKIESFQNGIYVLLSSLPPSSHLYRYDGTATSSSRKNPIDYTSRYWDLTTAFTTRKGEILSVVVNFYEQKQAVLRSTDGQKWDSLTTNGLANMGYFGSIAANSQSIFITTNNGRSLYVLDAPATSVSVREETAFSPEWRINPQPAGNTLTLNFTLPAPAHVRCTLHTVLGQEIATLADNAYASGQHDITATMPNMASGLYICRFMMDGRVVGSKSIILAR